MLVSLFFGLISVASGAAAIAIPDALYRELARAAIEGNVDSFVHMVHAIDWQTDAMFNAERRYSSVSEKCGINIQQGNVTFLHLVALGSCDNKAERVEIAEQLGLRGGEVDAWDGGKFVTPLMLAANSGHLALVQYLVDELNANVNLASSSGMTALMFAVQNGHLTVASFLIGKGASTNARTTDGATVLMGAVRGGSLELVKTILPRGANVNAKTISEGWSALLYAAAYGNVDIMSYLLDNGADIMVRSDDGDTVLIRAAFNLEAVEFLVSKGANLNARNNDGVTPLMSAAYYGQPEVVAFLKSKGATSRGCTTFFSPYCPSS